MHLVATKSLRPAALSSLTRALGAVRCAPLIYDTSLPRVVTGVERVSRRVQWTDPQVLEGIAHCSRGQNGISDGLQMDFLSTTCSLPSGLLERAFYLRQGVPFCIILSL
ncbi:hypothetical protein C8R44DRAFT_804011 [Mycena epipterygia]|nr:hypothetical protein C8R44DRAFT_804011 [Mycena epipterygia]